MIFKVTFVCFLLKAMVLGGEGKIRDINPLFRDAYKYWDFDEVTNNSVLELKHKKLSKITGVYRAIPGPVNNALQLINAVVELGDFSNNCLSNPQTCSEGFTIMFWVLFSNFSKDGVVLQLALSRSSRGITINIAERGDNQTISFYVNTPTKKFVAKSQLRSGVWHHIGIIWRRNSLMVYVNCSMFIPGAVSKKASGKKDSAKVLYLGANHARKKRTQIAVDDYVIWLRALTKKDLCRIQRKRKVNGGYSEWSTFSACSTSCSSGIKTRNRICNDPRPYNGGRNCSRLGPSYETISCNTGPCPVDGRYTKWSEFSPCTALCGGGNRYRTRNCTNPAPLHGGRDCLGLGDPIEVRACNTLPCVIHGNYSTWSTFGTCSVTCGGGKRNRSRTCTNPSPENGGHDCSQFGAAFEVEDCNEKACPIHGNYSEWSQFTVCSQTCGNATRFRTRNCSKPVPRDGGNNCTHLGSATEIQECPENPACPIHGNYTQWSYFTPCDKSCGHGVKVRWRTCTQPIPRFGGKNCSMLGSDTDVQPCHQTPCAIPGNFTEWSMFTQCSTTCGNGTKTRIRNCTNPAPQHGGTNCSLLGSNIETLPCFITHCPLHSNYSQWSVYSTCSATCGVGWKTRTRNCSNPIPMYGGNNCSLLGPKIQSTPCQVAPCPIHGNYSEWSQFTECSTSCNHGWKSRTRTCTNPVPQFNGDNCTMLGPQSQILPCYIRPCPINGNYSEWSTFSQCTKSCGGGSMVRNRTCKNPSPQYGGQNCSGPDIQFEDCNTEKCGIDGGYSEWSEFEKCSKSCENGTQVRRRYCNNPEPRHGGENCTKLGRSVEERFCELQLCPDIDLLAVFKISNLKWNNALLKNKSSIYESLSTKLKYGISELHDENAIRDMKILRYKKGSVIATMEVIYFSRNFPGAHILYDALYQDNKIGEFPIIPIDLNSTDVPNGFPTNITTRNLSSTSIQINWEPVPPSLSNGAILGHQIFYENSSNREKYRKLVYDSTHVVLNNLKKYSWYTIRISAINQRGAGLPSPAFEILTDEDVPDSSLHLQPFGSSISSTSLRIFWDPIDQKEVNGILRGYVVFYKANESSVTQNRTTSPRIHHMLLTDLEEYVPYVLSVAGMTSKGVGARSQETIIQTHEDVPSAAPVFHSCRNQSSTSIYLAWYMVEKSERNGIIRGYNVYYRKKSEFTTNWKTIRDISPNQTFIVIKKLAWFTEYLFRISANTVKGEGVISDNITVTTDEDVPCNFSAEFNAASNNSTSLSLDWYPLSAYCSRGILKGYHIFYKEENETKYQVKVIPSDTTETVLYGLKKFTKYNVSLAAFTSKGDGPRSDIDMSTDEDVPSYPPQDITAFNTSSTSIKVTWKRIPAGRIHGILTRYHLLLRKANESKTEKKYSVDPWQHSFEFSNLLKYTKYAIKIVGATSKGWGEHSKYIYVSTDEDVPSRTVVDFQARSKWSPTSIQLLWKPINHPFYVHGELLGYEINVILIGIAGEPLLNNVSGDTFIVDAKTNSYLVTGLEIYGKYKILVNAFTRIGSGPTSEMVAETCKCQSSFKTNWWSNPPYISKNSSEVYGIIPFIIPDIVSSCCGYCHSHSPTRTLFEEDQKNSEHFHKSGISAFRDNVNDDTQLHFPMYGQVQQEKYAKQYEFIPLVESPGIAFLTISDEEGAASEILLQTVLSTLPCFFLILILVVIFSFLIWLADNIYNPVEFPHGLLHGVYEGIWWSFISMTSIGYGDRIPRGIVARLIGVVWILIGALLMAFYTSVVTSYITAQIVHSNIKLYGTKVAVIHESSEHRLAVRKNAKSEPVNNLYDVYEALSKRRTRGALVDAYVMGSERELFEQIGVRIERIYDYSSAYGVVLAGEAKKLQRCFRKYVNENRKEIFRIIEENVEMVKEEDVTKSVKRSKTLIDSSSVIFKKSATLIIILLVVAITLGVLYELLRKQLRRYFHSKSARCAEIKELNHDLQESRKILKSELEASAKVLIETLKYVKRKHRLELKCWSGFDKRRKQKVYRTKDKRYLDPVLNTPLLQLRKLVVREGGKMKTYEYNPDDTETMV